MGTDFYSTTPQSHRPVPLIWICAVAAFNRANFAVIAVGMGVHSLLAQRPAEDRDAGGREVHGGGTQERNERERVRVAQQYVALFPPLHTPAGVILHPPSAPSFLVLPTQLPPPSPFPWPTPTPSHERTHARARTHTHTHTHRSSAAPPPHDIFAYPPRCLPAAPDTHAHTHKAPADRACPPFAAVLTAQGSLQCICVRACVRVRACSGEGGDAIHGSRIIRQRQTK